MKERRANENPIDHLDLLNVRTDRRHDRRAMTADECQRLLKAATNGPVLAGMTGQQRAMLYHVALETGLRRGELMSLTRGAFDLEAATVRLEASYSKHRREDVLPLRPAMVDALREHFTLLAPKANAFNVPCNDDMLTRAFRLDCAAAGIVYRDDSGRVADFHALRHTFISNLAQGGIHPKTAQQLARHSTITLTMDRYTHVHRGELANALDVLPDLEGRDQQRATGTNDTNGVDLHITTVEKRLPTPLPKLDVNQRTSEDNGGQETTINKALGSSGKPNENGAFPSIARDRNRTCTFLRKPEPKSGASASSATRAIDHLHQYATNATELP